MYYKVNKDDFYNKIGSFDVIRHLEGKYPYTTRYLTKHDRVEIGYIVDHENAPSDYYLKDIERDLDHSFNPDHTPDLDHDLNHDLYKLKMFI